MNRLLLLRHAKAGWAEAGMRDFDRPLIGSGRADAEALGRIMRAHGFAPELTLCSTAVRARETWSAVSRTLEVEEDTATFADALYNADAAGYLAIIRQAPETVSILVIGHNPIMEDLALTLAGDGAPEARKRVAAGFPTCGLAVLDFETPFSAIAPGTGFLDAFLVPGKG